MQRGKLERKFCIWHAARYVNGNYACSRERALKTPGARFCVTRPCEARVFAGDDFKRTLWKSCCELKIKWKRNGGKKGNSLQRYLCFLVIPTRLSGKLHAAFNSVRFDPRVTPNSACRVSLQHCFIAGIWNQFPLLIRNALTTLRWQPIADHNEWPNRME